MYRLHLSKQAIRLQRGGAHTTDVEKMVQVDLTKHLKSGTFHGVALMSDDGLRHRLIPGGTSAPMILLTHDIESGIQMA